MKKLITILILLSFLFLIADPIYYPFTEEEILNITNHIKQLEYSDSLNIEIIKQYEAQSIYYKQVVIIDSLELNYKDKEIALYKTALENKKEPKTWWEKMDQDVYFILGFSMAIGSSWVVKNVIE